MNSMGNNTLAKNLEATIAELGFADSLSWSTQSASAPDTKVAHYPRLIYFNVTSKPNGLFCWWSNVLFMPSQLS